MDRIHWHCTDKSHYWKSFLLYFLSITTIYFHSIFLVSICVESLQWLIYSLLNHHILSDIYRTSVWVILQLQHVRLQHNENNNNIPQIMSSIPSGVTWKWHGSSGDIVNQWKCLNVWQLTNHKTRSSHFE